MSAAAVPRQDPFVRAHQDAQKAVATFLPSLVGRSEAPPPPPNPMAKPLDSVQEAMRVATLVRKVEGMSSRVARGLPPEPPPPTPEQAFGNQLDSVHTRALQEAIASVPEEDRGKFISEAHDSAVKWIGAHNGKVVVHGKVEIASSPESAERLAAKIVNNEVEGHDQRKAEEAAAASQSAPGDSSAAGGTSDGGRPDIRGAASRPASSAAAQPYGDVLPHGAAPAAAIAGAQPAPVQPAPEIVPPGDGEPPATGTPPAVTQPEVQKVGTRKEDGHQITQPKPSVAANQKLALDASPELHQALSTLTQQVPGTRFDRLRPQKSTDRLDQKIEDQNDPDTLSDYLGAQVAADSPQAKDALVAALKKNFKVIEVDDEFLTGRKDKAQYPSTNVQVQLSNGVTAEVQIVPQEVQDATEESHAHYKAGRDAEEKGDNAGRDREWKQAADINQGQLAKFKQRNGIADAPAQMGDYEVMGDPIKIGSHTFLRVKQGGGNGAADDSGTVQDGRAPLPGTGEEQPVATNALPQSRPQPLQKGAAITLKDGTQAQVAYVDPNMNVVRVRTADGANRVINPTTDLADATS